MLSSLSFAATAITPGFSKDSNDCNGPLMVVYGNLMTIMNGDIIPSALDSTIFSSCQLANDTSSITYIIVNDGTTSLTFSTVLITGLHSSDFQITNFPINVLAAGESTSFTVLFDPSAVGLRMASIEIASDDSVNPIYSFAIQGNGLDYVECGYNSFEEVIIAQDFELGSISPWNYTIAAGTATATGGTAYAENGIPLQLVPKSIGVKSLQINNSNCTVLFDPVNTIGIRDVSFNFRLASFAKTPSEGSENGDYVSVAISTNGGNSWSNELEVTGSSQAKWSFLSGTGISQSVYSGTDFIVSYAPNSSGFLTSEGYSVIKLSGLPKTNDLRVRLTIVNNNTNEIWAIDDVKLLGKKQASTIWNGTFWSNGLPNNYTKAVIDGNYFTLVNGNITTCKCQINAGASLLIGSDSFLSSESDIVNLGTLTVEDGGTILQKDDYALNSGNATVKRNASIRKLDYVYWASPLQQFSLNSVSPNTPLNCLWKWNPIVANPNGGLGFWISSAGENMEQGKGYIVRGPNGFGTTPQTFNAVFSGATINNGVVSKIISRGSMTSTSLSSYTSLNGVPFSVQDDNWNLVGNPYPSALNVDSFLLYNAIENPVIEGSVRLWTHGTLPTSSVNPFYNSYQYNYTASDYITHNGTATLSGPNGFNGFIGSCQAFFVLMNEGNQADGSVVFKNSMRENTLHSNTQFYKSQLLSSVVEKHRIWLDLVNDSGFATRTVIGYLDNATNQKDVLYDAYTKLDGNQNFYSLIDNQKVCIQGRPLPFDVSDAVSLGYSIPTSGTYTIAIGVLDGLFLGNQELFIEDTLLHITHNLKQSPYQFYSNSGVFNDRFILKYALNNLSTNDFLVYDTLAVVVTPNHDSMILKSTDLKINSIVVYDLLGRILVTLKDLNERLVAVNDLVSNNQGLLIRIEFENDSVVYKKIVY